MNTLVMRTFQTIFGLVGVLLLLGIVNGVAFDIVFESCIFLPSWIDYQRTMTRSGDSHCRRVRRTWYAPDGIILLVDTATTIRTVLRPCDKAIMKDVPFRALPTNQAHLFLILAEYKFLAGQEWWLEIRDADGCAYHMTPWFGAAPGTSPSTWLLLKSAPMGTTLDLAQILRSTDTPGATEDCLRVLPSSLSLPSSPEFQHRRRGEL